MAVATEVVARFTADIGDVQSKMRLASSAFGAVGDAATFSSKRIREVGQAMSDAGAKMTVGLTLPLGGLAAAATNAAMSFETGMTKIIGLVGIASDEVANMGEKVLQMSGAVGKAPDELADGLFVVTSAGLRGSEAMSALGFSAKAGAAGLGETNDIARAVSGALSAYGSDVLSAADATDAIVATARAGNFETSQFAAAIGRVLPFAQQAGASFQEMGGAVALLTRVNGDAAQSVTQIQALFRAFVVPTEEAKTALSNLGMSAQDLRDSIAKDGLPETLAMLDKALGGNREELGRILGSSEAASAAFQILEADAGTIAETFGVVAKSSGMTNEAFAAVAATTQFQVNQTMAQLKATLIDLGNQFLPIVKSVMDFARAHLSAFNSLPGPVKTMITVMGAFLAAIGPLLFIVGKLIVVFSTLLSLMLKTRAVGAMRAAFMGLRGDLAASRASMKQTQTSIGMLGTAAQMARVTISASFRAIGAAAKGLLASIGPVGLAFIALGIAFEVVIGKSAEAEAKALEYADALDAVTGAATRASEELILTNLLSQELGGIWSTVGTGFLGKDPIGFKELSDRAGLTLFNITKAVQGTRDEYDALIATIYEAVDAQRLTGAEGEMLVQTLDKERLGIENVRRAREIEAQAALEARDAYMKSAAAHTDYRDAAVRSYEANQVVADSFDTAGFAAEQAAEEIAFMRAELELWTGTASAIEAVDRAAESIDKIGEAAVKSGTNLMGQTPKAREFRAVVLQAFNDSADAAGMISEKVSEQRAAFTAELIKMVAALRTSGVKDKDIRDFLGAMEELPASVSDIMRSTGVAIGKANFKDPIEKAFRKSVKDGTPMTADAMAQLADGATKAAKDKLGLTLEPELASIIKSGTTALRPTAFGNGELTGRSMGSGLSTGILRSSPTVQAAIRRVIQQAHEAAKDEAQSTSPSRLFARTGDDMASGVAMGWTRSGPTIYRAVRSAVPRVKEEGSKLANALAQGFAEALGNATGSIASAINEVFGSIPSKTPLERVLGSEGAEKFIKNNTKALQALVALGEAFDMIAEKVSFAASAITALAEATARPFGRPSDLMDIFGSESDIDGVIDGYLNLAQTITDSFSVLTDASIVGDRAAKANRANLRSILKQLEGLTRRSIALREEYEANLEALAQAEKDYADDVKEINARYDQLDKEAAANIKAIEDRWATVIPGLESAANSAKAAYERENTALQALINERDGFLKQIADGARSFLNNLSFTKRKAEVAAKQAVPEKQIIETVQTLANGIRVITKREVTPAVEEIAEAVEEPLSAMDIRSSLEARLADLRAFTQNIRTLVARGLDPALVKQFVSAGVSGAGEAAAALAAGSADEISAINSVQNALSSEVAQFGQYAADEWHNAAIAQQEAVVGAALMQQELAEKALAQANTMRANELAAAQAHADSLRRQRETELAQREAEYNAEKARLEQRNRELQAQMDSIAQLIQNFVSRIAGRLPQQTEDAGQDAARKLLAGFRKAYPDVFDKLNKLMDQLARSMNRVVTVTVRTVYEATGSLPKRALGGPVQARTAYLVGERGPEVFVPYGNGNIIPNNALGSVPSMGARAASGGTAVININVNAGMGADGAEIGRHIVDSLRQYERRNGPIPVSVTG